jgi:hypothetical protein
VRLAGEGEAVLVHLMLGGMTCASTGRRSTLRCRKPHWLPDGLPAPCQGPYTRMVILIVVIVTGCGRTGAQV